MDGPVSKLTVTTKRPADGRTFCRGLLIHLSCRRGAASGENIDCRLNIKVEHSNGSTTTDFGQALLARPPPDHRVPAAQLVDQVSLFGVVGCYGARALKAGPAGAPRLRHLDGEVQQGADAEEFAVVWRQVLGYRRGPSNRLEKSAQRNGRRLER